VKETLIAAVEERIGEAEVENLDFRSLLDVIVGVIQNGGVQPTDYEVVAEAAEELFEQYVRDFDIPRVPNIIEKRVDDMLKSAIRPTLKLIFDQFVAG